MEQEGGTFAPLRAQERPWVPPAATQPRLLRRAGSCPRSVSAPCGLFPCSFLTPALPSEGRQLFPGTCAGGAPGSRAPPPARPSAAAGNQEEQRARAAGGQGRAGMAGTAGKGPRRPRRDGSRYPLWAPGKGREWLWAIGSWAWPQPQRGERWQPACLPCSPGARCSPGPGCRVPGTSSHSWAYWDPDKADSRRVAGGVAKAPAALGSKSHTRSRDRVSPCSAWSEAHGTPTLFQRESHTVPWASWSPGPAVTLALGTGKLQPPSWNEAPQHGPRGSGCLELRGMRN